MIRRHLVLGVLCWTLAFAAGFAGTPGAGEGAKPKTKPSPGTAKTKPSLGSIKIYGHVEAKKDKDGGLVSATLTSVNRVEYQIVLDETGRKLAAEFDGKQAKVIGRSGGPHDARTFTVESYGAIEKEPKKTVKKKVAPAKSTKTKKPRPRRSTRTKPRA